MGEVGMVDLHCHILPGVDDGSDSFDTSCRMAARAADCGVRRIVATPHCNTRNALKNYRGPLLTDAFSALQRELDRWNIPIRILPGAEVLVRGDFETLLEQGRFPTLNNSRYLLMEYYFDESSRTMERSLRAVQNAGLVPVVAHPERYYAVQQSPHLAELWIKSGCLLQVNKDSVLGLLGEGAYNTAALLLRRGLVFALASDAHHFRYRSTDLSRLIDELEHRFPEADPDLLLRVNPTIILNDRPVP